jgi:hypothetical protein
MSGVKFTDLAMLGSIVHELSNGQARLDETAKRFRTFPGQPDKCDAAITLPGRHDVGLIKNSEGEYNPVFDPYAMDPVFKGLHSKTYIGKLAQEYTLQTAEYEAAQRGFTSERVEGEKGTVILELTQN